MPKKIRFEWDLPDALVDAVAPDASQLADTIKQAAVLDWVRMARLSLRHGAELLGMSYREFLVLMAAHRIPSITYEEGWLERELDTLHQERGERLIMISAVADSGPLIHLALVGQIALIPRYAHPILIVPQVYEEVVTQGAGKPGAQELAAACQAGVVQIREMIDQQLITRVRQASPPTLSDVDVMVIALAMEQQAALLSDDAAVRTLAVGQGLSVIGSVGVLTRARLDGVIPALKPLLDQLVASGFHLDPHGQVYQDAVRQVGEA